MPLTTGGVKTLWIGVFLFLGTLFIIVPSPITMAAALLLPGLLCLWSSTTALLNTLLIAILPAILGVLPDYRAQAILYLCLVACGITMSFWMKKGRIGLAVAVSAAIILVFFLTEALLVVQVSSVGGLIPMAHSWVGQVMDQITQIYTAALSPAELREFTTQRPIIEQNLIRLLPALAATSFLFLMWCNLLLAIGRGQRPLLANWSMPEWFVGIFILASVLSLLPIPHVQTVGFNLLILAGIGYFFQGLSIVAFYLNIRRWSTPFRWIIYLLILSQFYIMILVAFCGLFDTWFYFRKRIQREGEQV